MRYFIRFAYNGTDFHGSQTQPNGVTVQETMETIFSMVLRLPVALTFAGRTDAGVHAREMWAHMDVPESVQLAPNLVFRLNGLLPSSIALYEIVPVREDAHARFDATLRTYEYHITTRKNPFGTNLATFVPSEGRQGPLDFAAMNEAAQLLLGRHDFASFCKVHTDVKTTFCTVTRAEWTQTEDGAYFTIAADRFLRNMVRAVVGTLFDIGRHKISMEQLQQILDAKNRCSAGQSAPAEGLYLVRVEYPTELFCNASTVLPN